MKAPSLRWLLTVALIGLIAVASLLSSAWSFRESRIEAAELFDAKLAQSARVLIALADEDLSRPASSGGARTIDVWRTRLRGEGDVLATEHGHAYETKLAYQVFDAAGRAVLRSENAPALPFVALAPGFGHAEALGQHWRTFVARAPSGLYYVAAERDDIRGELARDIALGTLLPAIVELPLLALLVWFVVSWGCAPLKRVGVALEARAAEKLEPIAIDGAPAEIGALVASINGVLSRLRHALDRERTFTADAAHELRTPITALKVHVANLRHAVDAPARDAAQARIVHAVERIERLVQQLLDLARLEPGAATLAHAPISLSACVTHELAQLAPTALARHVDLSLETGGRAHRVLGDEVALGVLVRNLADNAIRYTPDGGTVRVELSASASRVRLCVHDSGAGIPADRRERVFDRFHRELGHDVTGSGLGLSIARRVAQLHGGALTLEDSPLGGLCACAEFPAADGDP